MADFLNLVEDWPILSRRLDEALALVPEERDAWLVSLSEPDPIKAKLRALLQNAAGVETAAWFETLPKLDLDDGRGPSGAVVGAQVGPYQLLAQLGRGGMGTVWLAERSDAQPRRKVALKLPHVGWAPGLAERMARERDILASLEHRNIARLYDAGMDALGRPYLALEYVDGTPIDRYCNEHALPLRERLGLVLQVASAVAYAHTRLIVHRDLKPSNILVTESGDVRLLDFGIAKILADEGAAASELTGAPGRVLTPDYASPEQIRDESIGTASDVYSLGVVSYELLAQVRPYRLARSGALDLADAIVAVEPPLASRVALDAQAKRRLKGDLDAILNKALKKRSAERYPTVEAFAADIQRHLDDLPVDARPDSAFYRARKFIHRNKLATAATLAVSLSLLVGSSLALWQSREALLQAERARRVTDFIGTVFAAADPYVAGKAGIGVRDLLDAAGARIERELQREPAAAAELLGLLAESYRNLGEVDRSLSAARRAYALAVTAYPANDPMRLRLMRILAQADYSKGDAKEAGELLRGAVTVHRQSKENSDELALSLLALASATLDQGQESEALNLMREAVARLDSAHGHDHPLAIEAHGALSNALMVANQPQEALQQAELAVGAARRTFADPQHPALIAQLSNYAYALNVNGRPRDAREQWQIIVAADRKIFNPRSPQVSAALTALGMAQTKLGELKDAQSSFEESLAILQGLGIRAGGELAIRHFSLGRVALMARRDELALRELDEAIAVGSRVFGVDSVRVRDAGYYRAEALLRSGRLDEAHRLIEARTSEGRAGNAPGLVRALRLQGLLAQARGDSDAALLHLQEAELMAQRQGALSPQALDQLRAELGRAQLEAGNLTDAEVTLTPIVDRLREFEPTATPQQAEAWLALGRLRLAQGRLAEAQTTLARADAFWGAFDPGHALAGEAAYWLGVAMQRAGHQQAATASLARARPLLLASSWPSLRHLALDPRHPPSR